MKNFLIGIILFAALIIGGAIVISFMDVTVPTKEMSVEIQTSKPTPTPSTPNQQPLPQGQ